MSRICDVCDKGRMSGHNVSHSNRKTNRVWKPNVQKVRVKAENGAMSRKKVCTRCLKGGKVERA
ncbi:MAG: 50S ribosomal protein L28 [Firmicutes bacterium]|nr:50S ribosomal protein L28 [Bacillota bacterium]